MLFLFKIDKNTDFYDSFRGSFSIVVVLQNVLVAFLKLSVCFKMTFCHLYQTSLLSFGKGNEAFLEGELTTDSISAFIENALGETDTKDTSVDDIEFEDIDEFESEAYEYSQPPDMDLEEGLSAVCN